MHDEVFFDVETKKLFSDIDGSDPGDLGVSVVSVYHRKIDKNLKESEGKMESFWEEDFDNMWPIFQGAERIVGFNSIHFDVPALKPYAPSYFSKLPHFDIMQKVKEVAGHRLSLDAIAKETLDREKTDTGLDAVFYWEKHDKDSLEKLQKYCEEDVRITRDVYDYALKNGQLLFKDKWNTLRQLDVDFEYKPDTDSEKQIGLF
jgi:DEAD/DEAH box helicase domain-containing protein